ncbi:MAG: TonB family protein [Candidatus Acidiferrales bacterium]
MRLMMCSLLLLCLAETCVAQVQPALCPRHIETPFYPLIALMAHVTGKVIVAVTIASDGKVSDAKVINHDNFVKLLGANAVESIRHWTFVRPPTAPYTEAVTYDYEMPASLKMQETRVSYDLPDLIRILAGPPLLQTSQSTKH